MCLPHETNDAEAAIRELDALPDRDFGHGGRYESCGQQLRVILGQTATELASCTGESARRRGGRGVKGWVVSGWRNILKVAPCLSSWQLDVGPR